MSTMPRVPGPAPAADLPALSQGQPFNDARVLPQTWYPLALSRELPVGQALTRDLAGRPVTLFRGSDRLARALSGPCPHLGADMGRGQVIGCTLRCAFHHWSFNGDGQCISIPAEKTIPAWARTFSYPVEEHYGALWVFNGPTPLFPVPTFEGSQDSELLVSRFPAATLNVHPHILILNGLDLQHFRTVHRFSYESEPKLEIPDPWRVRVRLHLRLDGRSRLIRLLRWLAGPVLQAAFTSWGGNMATIDAVSDRIRFHVLFSYVPTADGRARSRTFVLLPRSGGVFSRMGADYLTLGAVQLAVAILLIEDRTILDTLKFHPNLIDADAGLAAFMQQVNAMPVFDPGMLS